VLRVDGDGGLKLTVPRGASIRGGLAFVARQAPWIARERARQSRRTADWNAGVEIWWRGAMTPIVTDDAAIEIGADRFPRSASGRAVRETIETWARATATRELPARCLELAAAHGIEVAKVAVRNQRSRWGACSSRGVITLNWRLLQMPASVSDYVICHELAHRRQPNHSRRFWREVEKLCPTWRESERWLRRHGREIL
jgi:predicted metal-dependent hydrolase